MNIKTQKNLDKSHLNEMAVSIAKEIAIGTCLFIYLFDSNFMKNSAPTSWKT